ncbi:MAG: 1-acyl-sn-glycerol-3-phosphate acyltransferase [Gemmataceae bacterium]
MSDEHEDSNWFPRELRDYLSANVAHYGFATSWITLVVAQRSLLTGGDEGTIAGMLSGFALAVAAQAVGVWQTTRYRLLGLLVPASTALFVGLGLAVLFGQVGFVAAFLIWGGAFGGALPAARFATHRPGDGPQPGEGDRAFGRALAAYRWAVSVPIALQGVIVFTYAVGTVRGWPILTDPWFQQFTRWYFFGLSAVLCAWCWLRLFRPFFELTVEPFFRLLYRVRAKGPGVKAVPPLGPVLVIANHAAWFDPLFLAEFINRPVTPMMTESFYNIWFIRPILKYVFRVIVVRETAARREAPELREAIAALGRGECVVLFPEGYLRRKEEVELRRFAQGVWHILHARPDTPVVACWIEGGWESAFSWRGGPPWKGKRMDWRRKIDVGVAAPEVVPAGVLADPMRTRLHLMNRVSAARTHIGLEPLPPFTLPAGEAEPAQSEQSA